MRNQLYVLTGIAVPGEYALMVTIYRLHMPNNLHDMQEVFGRDYSQLSRIIQYMVHVLNRVISNLDWYEDRFEMYNEAINAKIAAVNGGRIPNNLSDFFGFCDGFSWEICRPEVW